MSDSGFKVHSMELGPMENFVYLIHDHATDRAAVVDPAWDVPEVLRLAADRGVRVRLLMDDALTQPVDPGLLAISKHANIEVRVFNPFPRNRSIKRSRVRWDVMPIPCTRGSDKFTQIQPDMSLVPELYGLKPVV